MSMDTGPLTSGARRGHGAPQQVGNCWSGRACASPLIAQLEKALLDRLQGVLRLAYQALVSLLKMTQKYHGGMKQKSE